ncbi:putative Immunoglobulin I-set domain protein [Verrucomicrobia bacterium]|nr:putative Immunoglobulin I-set domain protein [Verrucomicrobiota bacterium]
MNIKKTLLISLITTAAVARMQATPIWSDIITNYPLGGITTNSGGLWMPHLPGSLTAHDAIIQSNNFGSAPAQSGRHLSLYQGASEYINRWFDPVTTNGYGSGNGTVLYASFVVTVNFLPTQGGTYFAHFMDDFNFEYRGRIFAVQNTNSYPFTNTVANTWHLGVANASGDTAQGGGPSGIVPIDLAMNTDYQVVLRYSLDDGECTLWVNPGSESDTANSVGPVTDPGALLYDLKAFAFRQRVNMGRELVRNIIVGTNFSDVVTNLPAIPAIGLQPAANTTNYAGNPSLLEVCASGMGELTYTWFQIVAGPITNMVQTGTSQQLYFSSLSALNSGQYYCNISNAAGSTNSALANLVVNATPTAPGFTSQPKNGTASVGGNQTLSCSAFGTGPLTYQWNFNGTPFPSDGPNPFNFPGDSVVVSGSQTPTLTLTGVSTNETGNYSVTVTGGVPPPATSTNGFLSVNPPRVVSIAYLRSLENTSTWQAGDTADTFTLSNVVVMSYTNVTSGSTASYYVQDGTAGINLFITGDPTFRPLMGQLVSATGTLSSFNNDLEMGVNTLNPYQKYAVTDTNIHLLYPPYVFNLALTNNIGFMETNVEGSVVMLTNVWFSTTNVGSGVTLIVTNAAGMPMQIFFSASDPYVSNTNLPGLFAYTLTGVMNQFLSGTQGSIKGYEIYVTRLGDIVVNPPPAVTANISVSGNNATLTWAAVPYTATTDGAYSYSVLAAASVTGPYLPLATGLTFNTTNGMYTDTLNGSAKFYKVSSP